MLTAIKACKYLLPCGHCDKLDRVCTQYGSIGMTISGDSIIAEELKKYNQEQYDLWLNTTSGQVKNDETYCGRNMCND